MALRLAHRILLGVLVGSVDAEVVLAAFIKEDVGIIKMSFRSKGALRVNDFSSTYFNGGGHINAAGGRSELSFEDTVLKFKETVKVFLNE